MTETNINVTSTSTEVYNVTLAYLFINAAGLHVRPHNLSQLFFCLILSNSQWIVVDKSFLPRTSDNFTDRDIIIKIMLGVVKVLKSA